MLLRVLALAAVALAVEFTTASTTVAAQPDLFANYYVTPYAGGVPVQMYPSPHPTPPIAGRTFITYQPLAPHEFLYRHKRSYYTYHPGGGHTVTHVRWW